MKRTGKNNPLIIRLSDVISLILPSPWNTTEGKYLPLIKTLTDEEVSAASLAAYLAISLCSSSSRLALSRTLLRGRGNGKRGLYTAKTPSVSPTTSHLQAKTPSTSASHHLTPPYVRAKEQTVTELGTADVNGAKGRECPWKDQLQGAGQHLPLGRK